MLYGMWISVQEDYIRLKSCPSANDERVEDGRMSGECVL